MFGIEDPYVWSAYVLCVVSAALCVIYGLVMWNRGEEAVDEADIKWAAEERKLEEEL